MHPFTHLPTYPPTHRFDPRTNQYTPNSKEWVKSQIYQHLKHQAGQR